MKKRQTLTQEFKRPKGWILGLTYLLTALFCGVAITLAIISPQDNFLEIISYACYGIAAIFLGYSVYTFIIYAKSIKQNFIAFIKKFKVGKRLLEEYGFRTVTFASIALVINIAYVVLHVVLAVITKSYAWYLSLAIYYLILVFLRGGLVLYHRKKHTIKNDEQTEIKKYRTCGFILTFIPLCLLVPILQIIFLDKAFIHEGLSVFAFAAYAFYKIVMAIINVLRSGKKEGYTVQAVRSVGLADAFVSIFSLQTALLYAFSENANSGVFNLITGFAVFALTVALGALMVIRANKKLKEKGLNNYE